MRRKQGLKRLLMILAAVIFAGFSPNPGLAGNAAKSDPAALEFDSFYSVGPGDLLEISVWKDEALSKQVVVLPDGSISFPLIGQLEAAGKTVSEIQAEMTEKLQRYIPEPEMSVSVLQVNSMLVYVIGKVNKPGRFILNTYIDVLQALSMAGGLNPFAKENKIQIFRKAGDRGISFDFKYDEVSSGINMAQNIQLKRGDVIVVP